MSSIEEPFSPSEVVTYEAFGARGDGRTDDFPAIVEAHQYANQYNLPVRSNPEATYHLGSRALTAVIATDTDWSTSRFTIDDREVEDHKAALFQVRSLLDPLSIELSSLQRDQQQAPVPVPKQCYVWVEDDKQRRYIRRGPNQNQGVSQQDCFILHQDGKIEGAIDWDYDSFTRLEAFPIDEKALHLRGGVFTTLANRAETSEGYNYWSRNIFINRSHTVIEGLTHYVAEETDVGQPYGGFLNIEKCAHITLRNCFFTGHKIYTTIGSARRPVMMGSYDLNANQVVNLRLEQCRMNHICDRTRWGVIGTNFCKNIVLDSCTLSRMDTHMGVSGEYTIRHCQLGHMGLNAIGRGILTIENSHLFGKALVKFRNDYGSTWEGAVNIRDCRWTPNCGESSEAVLFHAQNDGEHDFGYPCFMPHTISIKNLEIEDSNHPEIYLFTDPDDFPEDPPEQTSDGNPPFPYQWIKAVHIKNLTTASGKSLNLSTNPRLASHLELEDPQGSIE